MDLIVAGGGPAGLTAAIVAARAGMKVCVYEPRRGPIDKACGEGLMPNGLRDLLALGVNPPGITVTGIRWISSEDGTTVDGALAHPARGVRRTTLHQLLLEAALDANVAMRSEPFSLGRSAAPWIIGADGLHSPLRRALGMWRPPRYPLRYGMRRHVRMPVWTNHVEVHFADRAEAYVTPVASDLVEVAFLFEPPATFDTLLAKFPSLVERLRGRPWVTSVRGAGPFEQRVKQRVIGNVLLVGDAAGYVDPITGEGVALGIATAKAAVASILANDAPGYEATWRALTRRHRLVTTALLRVARRRSLRRSMLRLAAARPSLFERALVSATDAAAA